MAVADLQEGGWRRRTTKRLKEVAQLHLRQLPCLHALLPVLRCRKRKSYQTLGQDEEGDGTEVEDRRQSVNMAFGRLMVRVALLAMIGLTVLFVVRNRSMPGDTDFHQLTEAQQFSRDSPVVLYIAAVELLVCGACSHTAAQMYRRRRHAVRHPADSQGRERQTYVKVELQKEPGLEHRQLFGLSFRPSTDGLECLRVESVRSGSLLDSWNQRVLAPTPEELMEEALGNGLEDGSQACPVGQALQQVRPGAAIVAINDAAADVGLMQLQLTQPKVTLWVQAELAHPSQLEADLLAQLQPQPAVPVTSAAAAEANGTGSSPSTAVPAANTLGILQVEAVAAAVADGPKCACIAMEDEEQQILTRWTVCAVIFGWVTILPVLLMQPHEQRPRQQLFRQYLLKPCLLMMPIAMALWLLDCIEVLAEHEMMRPWVYFGACHVVFPAVLVFYLMQMQAADEKLVLEQRKARQTESSNAITVVAEDPAPTLLKEFITVNPVALVWLGACAAIPLVACSFITPMQTARSKKAQGYVNVIYAPCSFLQLGFLWALSRITFDKLPQLYLAGAGLLLSVPCFVIWCVCLICASRYGREDMLLVEQQRRERAAKAVSGTAEQAPQATELVDCSEAQHREWELVYSA
mmetsp:Transcript_44920/g.103826  ORF Transcript_44920/g.103826 Transcript_44920/m.103826 type:complete len:635 (-) Transcript_44920:70-1974(-)